MTSAAPSPRGGLTPNLIGALWMLGSAAAYTLMTILLKGLGEDYPAALQALFRQIVGFAVMLPLMLRHGYAAWRTTRPWTMFYRSAASSAGLILAFYSFQKLPLADANALSFTRPLWVVPLAALLLRERLGWLRISAVLIGFGGVLVMLGATDAAMTVGVAQGAALASAFLLATSVIAIKNMTQDHGNLPLLSWAAMLGLVMVIPAGIAEWRLPSAGDFALLAVMGIMGLLTQVCFVRAMQVGDAAAMAPLDYARLLFGVAVGFFVFQEVPDPRTIIGALVVVAATLFITLREHQLARRGLIVEKPEENAPAP